MEPAIGSCMRTLRTTAVALLAVVASLAPPVPRPPPSVTRSPARAAPTTSRAPTATTWSGGSAATTPSTVARARRPDRRHRRRHDHRLARHRRAAGRRGRGHVQGRRGNDILYVGPGDTVFAGSGDDWVNGYYLGGATSCTAARARTCSSSTRTSTASNRPVREDPGQVRGLTGHVLPFYDDPAASTRPNLPRRHRRGERLDPASAIDARDRVRQRRQLRVPAHRPPSAGKLVIYR